MAKSVILKIFVFWPILAQIHSKIIFLAKITMHIYKPIYMNMFYKKISLKNVSGPPKISRTQRHIFALDHLDSDRICSQTREISREWPCKAGSIWTEDCKIPDFLVAGGRVRSYEHFKWRIVNKKSEFSAFCLNKISSKLSFFVRKLKVPKWGISGRPTSKCHFDDPP